MPTVHVVASTLLFFCILLCVVSLTTGYWRVFYTVSHFHEDYESHRDIWRFLCDGLPFYKDNAYSDKTHSIIVAGFITGATILMISVFLVDVFRIFYCSRTHFYLRITSLQCLAIIISFLFLLIGVVTYIVRFFIDEDNSIDDLNRRMNSGSRLWGVRPGYSFWVAVAANSLSLVIAVLYAISLGIQLRRKQRGFSGHQREEGGEESGLEHACGSGERGCNLLQGGDSPPNTLLVCQMVSVTASEENSCPAKTGLQNVNNHCHHHECVHHHHLVDNVLSGQVIGEY